MGVGPPYVPPFQWRNPVTLTSTSGCDFRRVQLGFPSPLLLKTSMLAAAAVEEAVSDAAQGSLPPAKRLRVEPGTTAEPAAAASPAGMEETAAGAGRVGAAQEQDDAARNGTEEMSVETSPLDAGADAAPEASTSKASSDRKGKGKDKSVPVHGGWTSTSWTACEHAMLTSTETMRRQLQRLLHQAEVQPGSLRGRRPAGPDSERVDGG